MEAFATHAQKNMRERADSFSTHENPTSPTYLQKKRLFQMLPNIENVLTVLLLKHGHSVFVKHRPVSC